MALLSNLPDKLRAKYDTFIAELRRHGDVATACDRAKLGVKVVAHRRRTDPEFEAAYDLALRESGRAGDYAAFLDVYGKTGNLSEALRLSGLTRADVVAARRGDPEFQQMYEDAEATSGDALEAEARRRAVQGVNKIVVQQGMPVYMRDNLGRLMRDELGGLIPVVETTYSDRLLELLLKGAKPDKYRENVKVDHAVSGGVLLIPAAPKTEEEWEANAQRSLKRIEKNREAMDADFTVVDQ